ncbi:Metalloenzyme, LuxS/M16 peptidase-like protein [Glomus cerebriforme]|uniref:Metalloenzyme, LuxS/M16 peptidase-like protein n=1 Tax=Glomus cerebriforme TaxID=658196 RepID=A0A397SQJ1_9GLOM|nr:Metalloenzyme, LuxS/M16 peptidase-like protein [Glomus cerebriforme]
MMATFKNLPTNFTISKDGGYAVLSVPIEKSDNDDRSYRLIRLSNELEALLIHDAKTDKSSAALEVHVGSLSDPDNLQGLAHYCEHLLFLGTEKYPKENEYKDYLSKHSGRSNAFTSADCTNYYFEVGPEFLEGALDRFSQFFVAPLFDPSCVDREIHAVDSEYKKNLQLDGRRMHQLERSLSNPNHPYSRFSTGNLETLKENPIKQGLNIRDELLKFHDKYYSANIMKLVVLGKESLDQLSQWIIEKFSAVKNKSIPIPTYDDNPLTENELSNQVFIKPVKDIRTLNMRFSFPDQRPLFHAKPTYYLSHLIGHEGVGSLLTLLKKKGWANYLRAGYNGYIGFGFYSISIDLTESGLVNYEDVVVHVFQYIEMLRQVGTQEWIYHEVKKIQEISFRFQEKSIPSRYTSSLSHNMKFPCPREWILSISLFRKFDPQLISESLDLLRHDNFVLRLVSQSFNELDQREKWYGTEYKAEPLSDKVIQALKNITTHSDLTLPIPNEFIPSNFETNKSEISMPAKRPDIIKNTQISRLWYKKDDTFWVPKANICLMFKSPLAYTTPIHHVKTELYTELVKDALNECLYNAEITGLGYDLYYQNQGLVLIVNGYNDKLSILLEKVVIKMKNLKIDPERFSLIKERIQRKYKNSLLNPPNQQTTYYLDYLTNEKIWTNEEKLEALENIKYEDIEIFYPELLSHLFIESLIHGNILKDDAIKISQKVEEILQPKALITSQLIGLRSVLIPKGKKFIYQRNVFDSNNINSAIEYYIQIGDLMNKELRTKSSLTAQIANEPFFSQLRTKEQLGYLVNSGIKSQVGSLGFKLKIQSERNTIHLENRIEDFLNKLQTIIENMSEQEYQKQIQSLIVKKLEKPKNLTQESFRYWGDIISGYYDFEQVDTDVEELRKITKQDLLKFYKTFINPNSPVYKKLSVHLRSQKSNKTKLNGGVVNEEENEVIIEELELKDYNEIINDMVLWKSHMILGPSVTPFSNI